MATATPKAKGTNEAVAEATSNYLALKKERETLEEKERAAREEEANTAIAKGKEAVAELAALGIQWAFTKTVRKPRGPNKRTASQSVAPNGAAQEETSQVV